MLSTLHRRRVLKYLDSGDAHTFSDLKNQFIESGDMNPTTLYRIIDAFVSEGIIHEIRVNDERIFTLCHEHTDEGVKLSYCTNCAHISETHFPLSGEVVKAEWVEYLKSCNSCRNLSCEK